MKEMKKQLLFVVSIVLTATFYAQNIPSYVPTNGLVGWWPFNGNANDESGNGNHGTYNGTSFATDRNGEINKAFVFDGINDYIALNKPYFEGSSSVEEFTYSTWVNCFEIPVNSSVFISAKEGYWRSKYIFIEPDSTIHFGRTQPNPQNYFDINSGNNKLKTNNWVNIVISYNKGKLNLFLDGKIISNVTVPYTSLDYSYLEQGNSTNSNLIGAIHPKTGITGFFHGKIDDIAIYNRALTQEEITALYLGCTKPSVAITPKSTTNIKENESVVLAATQGNGYTYEWFKDGVAIANATDSNYTATTPGNYTVKISTSTTCDSTSAAVTVKRVYALPNYLPANGLVGWWPFNGNANDESGNERNGVLINEQNGLTFENDRKKTNNSALKLNTTVSGSQSPYVSISNSSDIKMDLYTVNLWVNVDLYNQAAELVNKGSDNNSFFSRLQGLNGIAFGGLPIYLNKNMAIATNSWQMYTFVRDNLGIGKLYHNGTLILSQNISVPSINDNNFAFGLMPSGGTNGSYYPYNGKLDDIAIYNRALTQEEITALYLGDCTKPLAAITPKSTTNIKENEAVVLAATKGNGYTYEWFKNGVAIANATDSNYTATLPGVYTVKVTSASCDSTSAGVTVKRVYALPNYLPTNGLVGWWPFNGNANDESGNENHGTVNGATLTSDKNGAANKAYSFDGNSNSIQIPDGPLLNNNYVSVSAWFHTNSNLASSIIYKTNNSAMNEQYACLLNYPSANVLNWSVKNGGNCNKPGVGWKVISPSKTVSDGIWHNIVTTYDGKISQLYIDGILILSNTFNTSILDNCGGVINIGKGYNSNYLFNGLLDDIAIYNRALTQEEITALYLGEACTTPIATITPQSATSFCSGGSVNINAATNANYTYQWLNNGAPISAATTPTYKATTSGKYSVIVKNNSGCIDTSSVITVTVTPTPSLPILTGPSTLCYNSKAIFKASISGGTWGVANDYLLISSPQGLFRNNKMPSSNLYKTGVTYTLKSKDQLCSVTAQKSVWIRNVAATSVTLTASKQTLKVGEEVAATATTKITGNALFWMSASTSFVSVTGVTPYIAIVKGLRPATGANITFSVDDAAKGCRNTAFLPFTVTAVASMVENASNTSTYTTDLNVYPNPSNGMVTIENIGEAKTISLIDVTGRVLKTTAVNADRMRLDYSNITKGNYFISIQGENLKEMKSIVIE